MSGELVPLRVVIVDDYEDLRALVRITLDADRGFTVVGEAADGDEGIDAVATHHPDLVLLDVNMPGMDGLEALPLILKIHSETQVVMLSSQSRGSATATQALSLGATGFLEKVSIRTLPDKLRRLLALPEPADMRRT